MFMKNLPWIGAGTALGVAAAVALSAAHGADPAYNQLETFSAAFSKVRSEYAVPVKDRELVEGAIEGIPSAGFSLCDYSYEADFSFAREVVQWTIHRILKHGLSKGTLLNINIPKLTLEQVKGYKICRQANAKWKESFDERLDPNGRKYYWLKGDFDNFDKGRDTDEWALKNSYVSVVPVQFDLTSHKDITKLHKWTS